MAKHMGILNQEQQPLAPWSRPSSIESAGMNTGSDIGGTGMHNMGVGWNYWSNVGNLGNMGMGMNGTDAGAVSWSRPPSNSGVNGLIWVPPTNRGQQPTRVPDL